MYVPCTIQFINDKTYKLQRKQLNFSGIIRLKAYAKLQNTICLLCLPEEDKDYEGKNCTVTGYGKPSITALNGIEDTCRLILILHPNIYIYIYIYI